MTIDTIRYLMRLDVQKRPPVAVLGKRQWLCKAGHCILRWPDPIKVLTQSLLSPYWLYWQMGCPHYQRICDCFQRGVVPIISIQGNPVPHQKLMWKLIKCGWPILGDMEYSCGKASWKFAALCSHMQTTLNKMKRTHSTSGGFFTPMVEFVPILSAMV